MKNSAKCQYGFYTCSFIGQVDFCNTCDDGQNYQMEESILKKIRTCKGCRAFDYINNCDQRCSLGYYQEFGEPKELCPKPKTIQELINAPKADYEN